jgi:hypothetical protein
MSALRGPGSDKTGSDKKNPSGGLGFSWQEMPPLMYRDMANVARLAAQEDECEAKGATSSRAGRPSRRSPPEYPARAAAAGWVCRLARPPAGCIENFFSVQLPLDRLAASSTLPFGLFCE